MDEHGVGSVTVDGEDLSYRVRSLSFHAQAPQKNVLRLGMANDEVVEKTGVSIEIEANEVNVLEYPHVQFEPDQYLVFVDHPLKQDDCARLLSAAKAALHSENVFLVGSGVSVAKVPQLDFVERLERKLDLLLQLIGQPETFESK